jgi:hypothetical protein
LESQADPEYDELDYGSGETQIQSKSLCPFVTGKLISAPSPDEYHDNPRLPLQDNSQLHKRYESKFDFTGARQYDEDIEQPHYPLTRSNELEFASESDHEPELEDMRNTPYSGESHTHYAESPHYGPNDRRRCDMNAKQDPEVQYNEPEDEYKGESNYASRAPPNVKARSTRKKPKLRKNKSIESTTPKRISMLHILKIPSLKISSLRPLTVKISKLDQEWRNTHIKLKLQDQGKKPDIVDLGRILMVRDCMLTDSDF